MIKKIKLFGVTIVEIESADSPEGSPDFISNAHPAGFVDTRILPLKPEEE